MKGIVVDVKGKYAVLLTKDGRYVKIRNSSGLKVGYETDSSGMQVFCGNTVMKISSVAAAFLLTLGVSYGVYSYSTPYSYVSMDMKPSVELVANKYGIIIGANPLNEDGQKLIESAELKNKELGAGISSILENAIQDGYLDKEDESAVVLTVSSKNNQKSAKLGQNLEDVVKNKLTKATKDKAETTVLVKSSSIEEYDRARKEGLSHGKLLLIEKAVSAVPKLSVEELKEKPVAEIIKKLMEQDGEGNWKNEFNYRANGGKQGSDDKEKAKDKGNLTDKVNLKNDSKEKEKKQGEADDKKQNRTERKDGGKSEEAPRIKDTGNSERPGKGKETGKDTEGFKGIGTGKGKEAGKSGGDEPGNKPAWQNKSQESGKSERSNETGKGNSLKYKENDNKKDKDDRNNKNGKEDNDSKKDKNGNGSKDDNKKGSAGTGNKTDNKKGVKAGERVQELVQRIKNIVKGR